MRPGWGVAVLLLGLPALVPAGRAQLAPSPDAPPVSTAPDSAPEDEVFATLKLNVNLVDVFFTVKDKAGNLVPHLNKDDCTVSEDGAMAFRPANSAPGSYVELRAEMNVLTVLNTCPHPLDASPIYAPKPVHLAILRAAGIYGPGRGHLFLQYLKDQACIPGRGLRLVNMIHRDDLAASIVAVLKSGRPGEIYNAADDEPVPQIHFFRWLSETLGKNMPPFVSEDEAAPSKRAMTNKKVSNRKLRMELGCPLRYPTFRQGYTAEIQRLQDAGEL